LRPPSIVPTVAPVRTLTTIACLAASVAMPTVALADTESAASGTVTATLSYDRGSDGIMNVRLDVSRAGAVLVKDRGPRFPRCSERCEYAPLYAFVREKSIFVRNLDTDPEPEVLGEFYTGGANCCAASRIYDFDPARGRYARIDRNWNTGNHHGARDLDRDGVAELLSSDHRFEFRFGCGACTPEPIRIFRLRGGRLHDATRAFKTHIRRDLNDHLRTYRRVRRNRLYARGALAAVVADRYLLGQRRTARRTLSAALRRGRLRGYRYDRVPDGRAYVRALLRFLDRAGYR
jgi:hypothetical protein